MPLGGDRPNDTRFIPAKKKPPKKKVPKKAVRPDDRDVHLGREPAPEKSSPQAQAWAAPRTIFLPPALTKKKPKPKPQPEPRYDPGATKLTPKPTAAQQRRAELQGLVQSATERRKASLGLTDKKQEPTVTDAVATRQEMASAEKADNLRVDLQRTPPNMVGNAKKIRDYQTKLVHQAEGLTARDRLTLIDEVNQAYTDRTTPGAGLTPQMAKDAAVGLGRSVVNAGKGLTELPGNVIGQAMNPTVNRASPVPPGVQRAARVTAQLPGAKPFTDVMMTSAKRNEEVAEGIFGKALVNLVGHGDAPNTVAQAGGLVFGIATIGPVGKVGRGATLGLTSLAKVLKAERDIAAAVEAGRTAAVAAYHGPSIRQRTITAVRLKKAQAIQQEEIATLQAQVPDMVQGVNWANKEIVKIEDQLPGMTVAEKTKAVREIEVLTSYRDGLKEGIAKAAAHPVSKGRIKHAVRTPYTEEHAATIKAYNEAVDAHAEATVNFKPYKEWKAEKFEGNPEAIAARDAKNAADTRLQATKNDELFYRVDYEINPQVIDTPERRALAESLVAKYSNQKNALPPRVQDVDSVLRAMDMADQLATRGRAGRMWYEKSAKEIMRIARGSKAKAVKIAQLLAIYSPQQPILGNTSLAVRAMSEHAGSGRVTTGQPWQQVAAQGVLDGGDDYLEKQARAWKGRKTNNFAFNFIEEINKRLFKKLGLEGNEVTSDLWMARVFGYLTDAVSDGRYDFIEGVVRQIAKERGWKPKQVQAAIWTAIKDASDDVTANIDFAEGISRMFGQINFEAIPGLAVSPELHAQYLKLSPEEQKMFLLEKSRLVDQFLDDLGLAGLASQEGPGVYINDLGDLELNLGAQATLPMSLAPADTYRLPEVERDMLDFATAAIARGLSQDSAAWVRPFVARATSHSNTMVIRLGRRMSPQEASDIAERLGPAYGVIHMGDDGFMVRNFGSHRFFSDISPAERERLTKRFIELHGAEAAQGKAGQKVVAKWAQDPQNAEGLNPVADVIPTKDFHVAVDAAIAEHPSIEPDVKDVVYHASDGELVQSSSYSSLAEQVGDGAGSASHLRATSAADRLASDSDAIDQRYFSRRARAGRALRPDRGELAPASEPQDWLETMRDETGNLNLRAFGADPDRIRTLSHGGKTVQMQGSRSQFARRVIEDPSDKFSRWLMGDGKRHALGRFMLPTASAEKRVTKQAGRQIVIEGERSRAAMRKWFTALPRLEGTKKDTAHFWWAQLPDDLKNVEGLKLVRSKMADELAYVTSGEALQDLLVDLDEVTEAMKNVETGSEYYDLLSQQGSLKMKIRDIEPIQKSLSVELARLNKVIASNPELDPKVIEAVAEISKARERILLESGALDPDIAAERTTIISDWLGLEPDGSEIYIGHRLKGSRIRGARTSGTPAGLGLGRPKAPQGVGSRNRLILAAQGRLRASTHVAAEDWSAAQVYESARQTREDLFQMGKPFNGESVGKDEYLVNPKGKLVPAKWQGEDELSRIAQQGFNEEEISQGAKDIIDGFLARGGKTPEQQKALIEEWGTPLDDLRVIDKKTADRYANQFRTSPRNKVSSLYDGMVDVAVASIVFARIGYVPKNVAANIILMLPHQGVFFFANAPRAVTLYRHHRALRFLIEGEMGGGATMGLARESKSASGRARGLPGAVAHGVSAIADSPMRMSAFIHEAAAAGVIPKYNHALSEQDIEALHDLFTNPKMRPKLNDIRSRANEAMVDFSRLSPLQRRMARRVVIIPSWLWSGSRYPFHFAATHPGRAAAIGYLAAGAPGAPIDVPSAGDVLEGSGFTQGVPNPFGAGRFRTNAMDPVSTPISLATAAYNTARGGISPYSTEDTAWSSIQPVIAAGQGFLAGEGIGSFKRLVPGGRFLKDMVMGAPESAYYPEDTSRLGRLKREVGVLPIKINDTKGTKSGPADTWVADLKAGKMTPFTVVEKMLDRRRRSLVGKGELEKAQAMGLIINDVQGSLSFNDYQTLGVSEINKIISETNVTRRALKLKEVPSVTQEEYDEVKKEAQEAIETVEKIRRG